MAPLLALVLLSCAARGDLGPITSEMSPGRPMIDQGSPTEPLWITFEWEAREREARYKGRGAARVEPPTLARLDLFGPRGEGYLSAAIVDGVVRLPTSNSHQIVPPPALLWGALGIFHPPEGIDLAASEEVRGELRLEYRSAGERWRYYFDGDRLRRVEWQGPDGAQKTVELKGEGAEKLPREAIYRDWAAFTELKIRVVEVEVVEAFPPEIWQLDAD